MSVVTGPGLLTEAELDAGTLALIVRSVRDFCGKGKGAAALVRNAGEQIHMESMTAAKASANIFIVSCCPREWF